MGEMLISPVRDAPPLAARDAGVERKRRGPKGRGQPQARPAKTNGAARRRG